MTTTLQNSTITVKKDMNQENTHMKKDPIRGPFKLTIISYFPYKNKLVD